MSHLARRHGCLIQLLVLAAAFPVVCCTTAHLSVVGFNIRKKKHVSVVFYYFARMQMHMHVQQTHTEALKSAAQLLFEASAHARRYKARFSRRSCALKNKNKGGPPSVFLLGAFYRVHLCCFGSTQVFASVITEPAKWPARERAAFRAQNETFCEGWAAS